jgi:hypothetical protein
LHSPDQKPLQPLINAANMGHHFIPRSFKIKESYGGVPMPDFLVGQKLPTWLSDSPFNVLKPTNITQGGFYELHHKVDPDFNYANLPARAGGGGWNGKTLGFKKYGLLGRFWHGSPAPLNAAVGVGGAVELAKDDGADGVGP